ncbi:LD-carboxypeptidase [Luedemannella helvata]|uniref:LD-carboxypeptidase n=1 Tax=Luedemannella helvata TaxID=349315 RepID=A0ABN2JZT7_9ACTN
MSDLTTAVRPAALRPGDRVMLVSPSGPTRPERVARGVELLSEWGLSVDVAPNVYARSGYLAGTDDLRLADLMTALGDPTVRGVICTRGGYGVQRIVDGIDMAVVRADPKIVVGFSDITALQLSLWRGARLASVHGPGAAWLHERTGPDSVAALRHALMDPTPVTISARQDEETSAVRVPAAAVSGPLLGGNLCLLAATVGTPDFPDMSGAILLIEEVGEPPYKVDRMLTHLRRAGVLSQVAGVAVGQFTDCADGWSTTIVDCLLERLTPLGVPVLGGLPIGHGRDQIAVPFGTLATLDATLGTLTVAPAVR